MLWFRSKKRAKNEAKNCDFWPCFLGRFIDDIAYLGGDNPKSNFKQENPKALRLKILMPLFSI